MAVKIDPPIVIPDKIKFRYTNRRSYLYRAYRRC